MALQTDRQVELLSSLAPPDYGEPEVGRRFFEEMKQYRVTGCYTSRVVHTELGSTSKWKIGGHSFRRLRASERKDLSLKDVAYAGGWKDTTTVLNVYQQPDVDSLQRVVEGGRRNIKAV